MKLDGSMTGRDGASMKSAATSRFLRTLGMLSALVVVILLGVAPAAAQNADLRQLLDRIDRLERDIRTLNVQRARGGNAPLAAPGVGVGGGGPAAGDALARGDARLAAFDEELRALTGLAETLSHRIDQIDDRLNKLVGDMDFRLSALERAQAEVQAAQPAIPGAPPRISAAPFTPPVEKARPDSGQGFAAKPQSLGTISQSDLGRLAVTPAGQPPAAQAAPPISVLPEGTPKEQYDFAFKLLIEQNFDQAESVLRAFLGAHPNDALASNAQYWLGETYYVRQDFATAAKVFTEGYKKYKGGAKAADSLLKLSMSLASSEKPEAACFTLAELDKAFPNAPRHIKDEATRQRKRNGCK